MTFDDYLLEAKHFAYSKDGVRKEVKSDAEAANWRDTIAKPPKAKKEKAPKAEAYNWSRIAQTIEMEVGNHFPDTDGWDAIAKRVRSMYPHLTLDTVGDVINQAAKKQLRVKDFWGYVERFHKDHGNHDI